MHYAPHALLNCVAWFSLLCYGDAAKGVAPSDVLSHFAQTVGTVLVPTLANELHNTRANRSTGQGDVAATRRQTTPQDAPLENNNNVIPGAGLPFGGQGFPYQYERTLSYRYPPYAQQLSQNFFPGGVGFGNGVPLDPRFFQGQLGGPQLAPIQPTIPKPLNANINGNGNNNLKETGNNNVNSIQPLESNGDSKSSAQSRQPYDDSGFAAAPFGLQGGAGLNGGYDPTGGNFRVNNRFSAVDYERYRQNYYSNPQHSNQQRAGIFGAGSYNDGSSFNGGSQFRSNLDYNGVGVGRIGGPAQEGLRSGNGIGGIGDPYFGSFLPGPYQTQLNYNSLPGGGGSPGGSGGGGEGPPFDGFERSSNFRSPFGNLQYPGGFNFYPGGGPGGAAGPEFNEPDSSLRASSSKETVSSSTGAAASQDNRERETLERLENAASRPVEGPEKVRFVTASDKSEEEEEEEEEETKSRSSDGQA